MSEVFIFETTKVYFFCNSIINKRSNIEVMFYKHLFDLENTGENVKTFLCNYNFKLSKGYLFL